MLPANSMDYRAPRDETELRAHFWNVVQALAVQPPTEPDWFAEAQARFQRVEPRALVAPDGAVTASLGVVVAAQGFGGRAVPSGAVTTVAVPPEFRGGGVAAELMRNLVRELRGRGVPLSVLYPASFPLYRRAGYELAGAQTKYRVKTRAIAARETEPAVRPMRDEDRARVVALGDARALLHNGCFVREAWLWQRVLAVPRTKTLAYVVEDAGALEGYVAFVHRPEPTLRYELHLTDLVARTPRAFRRLLALLGSHGSMAPFVVFNGAPADPLVCALRDAEGFTVEKRLDWMLRLCDVPRALEARGYPRGLRAQLHLEVRDEVVPENQGRWVLEVADGAGRVRAGGEGHVRADVRALAPLYSGYLSARALAAMGELAGPEGALEEAEAVFAGPAPWMPDMF